MAGALTWCLLITSVFGAVALPSAGQASLLQTYGKALNSGSAKDTPITRVVNLLKEMDETLKKEQEEDEDLNKQLGCWCNNGKYEKNAAIEASTAKIAELTATIEGSDAKSSELANSIKDRYTPEMCVSLLRPTLEQSYFLICSCTVLLQSSFLDHCLQ